ncbi:carboxylating nicotinate-nucleotide diphosphorylase [Acetobacter orleanensis]|uniref:Probable nicotinate-nucleotide pyrophosphorylase [carboxylating] n=1 Tax=Acetobacter orleanensis TaxID=104099 RepID=A0A4Y3THH9_9PROT|nr:carboxylating nicotinate-nucleotide diphosphorylase [Acetobacter orleanensis]KXV62972.1 nicotinate-nucleotide pyrophosphorylase [Acetobacter orleanensis]PCD79322.1 nicotinate-nucleotide diphosphorylase (carboxylating) [Acetobacter orleanensis]GAN69790.1 nicotinate-nucleotide pyrophosphorylase [Acetobacter orleanensis JCM 7639]GBR23230.1 nicotinate-nucleotide pyrophosphorylase [Acetobacter orleanensis NRIC 0473]GEB82431.1 nicotinate-nucleotide diphosphorylase (carboxylating) [Acetobacter orl
MLPPLPDIMLEPLVRAGLLEDLGRGGDLTTNAVLKGSERIRVSLRCREKGVLAGLDLARLSFHLMDPSLLFERLKVEGAHLEPGDVVAVVEGSARSILTGERVGLNFLSHLSGIATATADIVASMAGTKARLCCTRKTLPGLRAVQKYAVRAGGGISHRMGLDDAILIKDNHIALVGSVQEAVARARKAAGHMVKIEVEVDTPDQLQEVLAGEAVDAVLLDNMPVPVLRTCVEMINGRLLMEASGGITPQTAAAIAQTGVDLLSVGWLTHSVRSLDFGLDFEKTL